jgi:hypothetical protein
MDPEEQQDANWRMVSTVGLCLGILFLLLLGVAGLALISFWPVYTAPISPPVQ